MSSVSDFLLQHLKTNINPEQSKDSGLAFTLILLLIGYLTGSLTFYILAIPSMVLVMSIPVAFKPFGILWYSITAIVGSLISKIILTITFYALVYPVALFRKAYNIDSLKLREFKKGNKGIMHVRDHTYTSRDIEKPY